MSSHSVQLAKALRAVEVFKEALRSTAHESEYQRGLYNGFEMFRAMLSTAPAQIIEKSTEKPKEVVNETYHY